MPYRAELCRRLPAELAAAVRALDAKRAQALEEIRIYDGCPAELVVSGNRIKIPLTLPMADVLAALSAHALYSCEEQMAQGYIPLPGGHRAGVCGRLVCEGTGSMHMSAVTSVCIRIARHVPEASLSVRPWLMDPGGTPRRVLLLGAPGCGKTTVLRDALIWLAQDMGLHVAVADEREELFTVQRHCAVDVLSGVPKAKALSVLLRSMAPQVLAADEIGSMQDAHALQDALRCGAGILATAHAGSMEDAACRPALRMLMRQRAFDSYILLGRRGAVLGVFDAAGRKEEGA